MVVASGVPATILIYEVEDDSGVLITCKGSGFEDTPPVTMGEKVDASLLGGLPVDVFVSDRSELEEIEELIREDYGKKVVQATMEVIKFHARTLGLPLD